MKDDKYSDEIICVRCKGKFQRRKSKRTGEKLVGGNKSLRPINAITCSPFCSKEYNRLDQKVREKLKNEK